MKLESRANIDNFRCEQKICGLLLTMYVLFCFERKCGAACKQREKELARIKNLNVRAYHAIIYSVTSFNLRARRRYDCVGGSHFRNYLTTFIVNIIRIAK